MRACLNSKPKDSPMTDITAVPGMQAHNFVRIGAGVTPEVEPLGTPTVARQIAATASNANTALTASCRRISIKARTADVRYAVGAVAQTASATASHFLEMGERLDIAVPAGAHIAIIRDSLAVADGIVCITELS